jgi:hypothetical protein
MHSNDIFCTFSCVSNSSGIQHVMPSRFLVASSLPTVVAVVLSNVFLAFWSYFNDEWAFGSIDEVGRTCLPIPMRCWFCPNQAGGDTKKWCRPDYYMDLGERLCGIEPKLLLFCMSWILWVNITDTSEKHLWLHGCLLGYHFLFPTEMPRSKSGNMGTPPEYARWKRMEVSPGTRLYFVLF